MPLSQTVEIAHILSFQINFSLENDSSTSIDCIEQTTFIKMLLGTIKSIMVISDDCQNHHRHQQAVINLLARGHVLIFLRCVSWCFGSLEKRNNSFSTKKLINNRLNNV